MAKSKKYIPAKEFCLDKPDRYIPIYHSQIISNAFCDLSNSSKAVYHAMRDYARFVWDIDSKKRTPKKDFGEQGLFTDVLNCGSYSEEKYFYFPLNIAKRYNVAHDSRKLSRCVIELVEHGFISIESKGGVATGQRNIYSFSHSWSLWKK